MPCAVTARSRVRVGEMALRVCLLLAGVATLAISIIERTSGLSRTIGKSE